MYSHVRLDDVDAVDVSGLDPDAFPVGYELRPDRLRPTVWSYEAGESNRLHYQQEQEELYVVLEGEFELEVDGETVALARNSFVAVEPAAKRRLTALTDGTVLVIGAPNVKDDGVPVE